MRQQLDIEEILDHIDQARRLWSFEEDPGPGEYTVGPYSFTIKEREDKNRSYCRYLLTFEKRPLTMAYNWDAFFGGMMKEPRKKMAKLSIEDQDLRNKIKLKCLNDWGIHLTEDQITMCIYEMEEQKLSLFHGQIWPNRRKYKDPDSNQWLQRITWDKSIDGYRAIAHRSGRFAGVNKPEFDVDDQGQLIARVTVYRLNKDGSKGAYVSEVRYSEFVMLIDEYQNGRKTGKKKPNQQWETSPYNQLAVTAERHALRKAFQDIDDPADEIEQVADLAPAEEPPEAPNAPSDAPSTPAAEAEVPASATKPSVTPLPGTAPQSPPEPPKGTFVGIPDGGFRQFAMYNKDERIMAVHEKNGIWHLALDSGQVASVGADGFETERRERTDKKRGGFSWINGSIYYGGEKVEKVASSKKDPAALWLALDSGFKVMVDGFGKELKKKERRKEDKSEADSTPNPEEPKAAESEVDVEGMTEVEEVRKAWHPLLAEYCRTINGGTKISPKDAYAKLTGVIIGKGQTMNLDDHKVLYQALEDALEERRAKSA